MAADIRKDNDPDIESCSCSFSSESQCCDSLSEVSTIDFHNQSTTIDHVPSHIIVQRQFRDVISAQKLALEQHIKNNIDVLSASKESFHATTTSHEERIQELEASIQKNYVAKEVHEEKLHHLEETIKEEYVPKEKYTSLQLQLEEEFMKHTSLQSQLKDVLDRLDAALGQIAQLTKQREEDKMLFSQGCDTLRDELSESHSQNRDLQARLSDKESQCLQLQEQVEQQNKIIEGLEEQYRQQKLKFEQKVTESHVEKEQEAYLNRMLSEMEKNKKK